MGKGQALTWMIAVAGEQAAAVKDVVAVIAGLDGHGAFRVADQIVDSSTRAPPTWDEP